MEEVRLPDDSFDVAFCLSVIEHIPTSRERASLMNAVYRLLRPGGHFVLTVDLSLQCHPFTSARTWEDLRNVSIPELLSHAPFQLVDGEPSELYGMKEFAAGAILARVHSGELYLGWAKILTQCMVLRKPTEKT